MKKYLVIALFALLGLITACGNQTDTKKNTAAEGKNHKIAKQYTCIMDPDVLKDKPGICPKCGMELVEKEKVN
jgi:protein involved in sex pheromone biosynthesis